jgi:hypothetical protein
MKTKIISALVFFLSITIFGECPTINSTVAQSSQTHGVVKWKYNLGYKTAGIPAIGPDGTIYVNAKDSLCAINPGGALKWQYSAAGAGGAAIGTDGTAYFQGSTTGTNAGASVYAVGADGTLKWAYQFPGLYGTCAPANAPDGTIYVSQAMEGSNPPGFLYALNPDGTLKWSQQTSLFLSSSPVVGPTGRIYVLYGSSALDIFNPDGTSLNYTSGQIVSVPVIDWDGTAYFGSSDSGAADGVLHALRLDGTDNWTLNPPPTLIGYNGTLYTSCQALSHDFQLQWSFAPLVAYISPSAIGSDGTIYMEGYDYNNTSLPYGTGFIYAVDPNGNLLWSYVNSEGVQFTASVAMGPDGTLYGAATDGYLYAISTDSAGPANTAWPSTFHDSRNTGCQSTLKQAGHSISGLVTSNSSPLQWTTIIVSNAMMNIKATTGSDGTYTFTGIDDGNYSVTAVKYGYTFTPTSINVQISGGDATGRNFTAGTQQTHSISGSVTAGGDPLSGVAVSLSGAATQSAQTGADGSYVFSNLQSGVYTITPSNSANVFSPAGRSVNIGSNDLTGQDFSGITQADAGSVAVTIQPPAAVASGAQWRLDSGEWLSSGETLSGPAPGTHTVNFKAIEDWGTPPDQRVVVQSGQTAAATGTYSPPAYGSIQVILQPALVVGAGALWNVDAGGWMASGAAVTGLTIGPHTVTFKDVTGWTTPVPQTVDVTGGEVAATSAYYAAGVGTPDWEFQVLDCNIPPTAPAIGSDGTVYTSDSRYLYAISPGGTLKWTYADPVSGLSLNACPPALGPDGTIYVSDSNYLYAISPGGTLKWNISGLGGGLSPAIGSDGTIYKGSGANLSAVSPSGTILWTCTIGGNITSPVTVGQDKTIYVAGDDKKLYALNPDASRKWTYTASDVINTSPAMGSDGAIYIGTRDYYLNAVTSDGALKWKYYIWDAIQYSVAIGPDGVIYTGAYNSNLYALNPDGSLKWTFQTGWPRGAPLIDSNGTIYLMGYGTFWAVNPDGTLKWSITNLGYVNALNTPVMDSDGTIYIIGDSDANGYYQIIAVRSGSKGPANSAWPMYQHDAFHSGNKSQNAPAVYSISGAVGTNNTPLAGVTLTLGGTQSGTVTTGNDGSYLFSDLANGSYTITPQENGYTFAPVSISQTINGASVPNVNFTATPAGGSITVNLTPDGAVAAGAQWRVDSGTWLNSGATVSGVAEGGHIVSFKDVSGWSTPAPQNVTVVSGATTVAGVYGASGDTGSLTVTIGPWQAVAAGAMWMVDAGAWQPSGAVIGNLQQGLHTVTFAEIPQWGAPGSMTVNIVSGQSASITIAYTTIGTAKWMYTPSPRLNDLPVTAGPDGTVYVAARTVLQAINPDGTLKWEYEANDLIETAPFIDYNGNVCIWVSSLYNHRDDDVSLYVISPSGTLGATYDYPYPYLNAYTYYSKYVSFPALGPDGTVYTHMAAEGEFASSGQLRAVAPNGTIKWTHETNGRGSAPVIGPDGTLYLQGVEGNVCNNGFPVTGCLFAFNPDGSLKWKIWQHTGYEGFFLLPPSVDQDGTIYAVSATNLCAFNPDGTTKWTIAPDLGSTEYLSCPPVVGPDGTLYVSTTGKTVFAVSPGGAIKWTQQVGNTSALESTTLVTGSDGTIYAAFYDSLYALGPDGTTQWQYDVVDQGLADLIYEDSIGIGPDGTVYVVSRPADMINDHRNCTLHALATTSKGPADSAWPLPRHDLRMTANSSPGLPAVHTISGAVLTGGEAVPGVTVALTGPKSGTYTVGANGSYSFAGLADGSYTVTPTMQDSTFDPPSRTVTVSGGDAPGQDFSAILPTGSLAVTITPAEAAAAGAQWKVDNGTWRNSGDTVSSLTIGSHTLAFKDISNWIAPQAQTVQIAENQTTTVTGVYTPPPATHLSVSAPSSATAGTAFNFTVTALDAFNHTVPSYTGTVYFTSTDQKAVLPAYTTLTSGTGTFLATLNTTGSQTITATDNQQGTITGTSGTVSVTLPATHFDVSAPSMATAGTAVSFTVTARAADGSVASGYSGTARFTSSDPSATLPSNSTLTNGTGTFSATFKTAGNQTITATDGSITGISGTVSVTLPATHFSISAPSPVVSGISFNFTVTALDMNNHTVTGYSGTVHCTSSDSSATLPSDSMLTNGAGTFTATFKTTGNQTITATDTTNGTITGISGTVSVTLPATHFSISAPSTATAGTAVSFTVSARAADGSVASGYSGTVRFTSSDPSATLPANSTLTNGTGTFSATFKTAGNQTITATDTTNGTITGISGTVSVTLPATHFNISAPSMATAGTAVSFTVTARAADGSVASGYSGTVRFTSSDPSATLPANSTLTNGRGTFSATFKTTGNQTIKATNGSISGVSSTISVSPPPATHYSVSAPSMATAGTAISFTVTALGANGSVASGYSGTVRFTSADQKAVLPKNSKLTKGTGKFTATLKTTGNQTITATDTVSTGITGTSGRISVRASR